ncbi:cytochrome P450 [Streptomyces mashuensis]|uniref:Cytochrome P450 n=1 Tax=Streptomyces mashuensis TaxID=33904 RepID=A0A919ATS5_9ACTN|nr:cytochrome P450 [Streptomyces mashuensis]GHF26683.1 cytochrome P450 [Streptomyces mashuensis]
MSAPAAALPPFRTEDVDVRDPYPLYRRYREADPVHGSGRAWTLFRHADVAHVLTSRAYGRGTPTARLPEDCPHLRRTTANWMVFMDPPRHTRVRSLVARSFTPRMVEGLRPRIRRLAAGLVAALAEEETADLVAGFCAPFPILVISELLGMPAEDRPWFRERAVGLQQATSSRVARSPGAFAAAEAAARDLDAYFRAELDRRRSSKETPADADPATTDLIAEMLRAEEDEPLGDDTLVGTCIHLLTAGHETTTNLVGKGLLALLANPGQLALLRARPELAPGAVEELVRYDSPVQMISRWAREDDEVGGRKIPGGSHVTLVLGSANRDPAYVTAPDRLDIRRDARRHAGFGMGAHYCLGAPLARVEAEEAFTELLRSLPWLTVAEGPDAVRYADDLVFHGPERLLVRPGG